MNNINMLEIWKSVLGYQGLYEVSNFGRVRSLEYNGRKRVEPLIIGGYEATGGYLQVKLRKGRKYKQLYIHRLVAEAFIGPIPKGMQVNHIDEDKKNNCLSNLEIVSPKQNTNHGTRNTRISKSVSKQLDLIEIAYPHREFTFRNSRQASKFFGYKDDTVVKFISYARKNDSNILRIKGRDYYFSQEQKGTK